MKEPSAMYLLVTNGIALESFENYEAIRNNIHRIVQLQKNKNIITVGNTYTIVSNKTRKVVDIYYIDENYEIQMVAINYPWAGVDVSAYTQSTYVCVSSILPPERN